MPDIRAFFGPKGGAAPPKPAPKEEDPPKKGRGSMWLRSSFYEISGD
jgi:hypothetical protein